MVISGAKLNVLEDDDEEEPATPKFRDGSEILEELDLEPVDSMDCGEEVAMNAAEKKRRRYDLGSASWL
jgi:hypothetical protein